MSVGPPSPPAVVLYFCYVGMLRCSGEGCTAVTIPPRLTSRYFVPVQYLQTSFQGRVSGAFGALFAGDGGWLPAQSVSSLSCPLIFDACILVSPRLPSCEVSCCKLRTNLSLFFVALLVSHDYCCVYCCVSQARRSRRRCSRPREQSLSARSFRCRPPKRYTQRKYVRRLGRFFSR